MAVLQLVTPALQWHCKNTCQVVGSYKLGLVASLVVRLIGLLLVFASPSKIVHNVRDEMAEFVVPLGKEIEGSLTRQGMQNIRGLH